MDSDTYSVIGYGSNFNVMERELGSSSGGSELDLSGTVSTSVTNDSRTLILEREYAVDGTYDFTDFMDCIKTSINIISARGSGNSWGGYHGSSRRKSGSATNECCFRNTTTSTTLTPENTSAADMRWEVDYILFFCAALMFML